MDQVGVKINISFNVIELVKQELLFKSIPELVFGINCKICSVSGLVNSNNSDILASNQQINIDFSVPEPVNQINMFPKFTCKTFGNKSSRRTD